MSPANEEAPGTTAQSERRSKARSVHHHRGRATEIALGSYYCGYSPCFRIYPPAIYGYAALVPDVAPVYRESTLWWPVAAMEGVPDITATEGHDGGSSVLSEADDRRPLVSGLK
jgi:hypothetical protein